MNNVLISYVKADASGFYTFQVPLVYGNSDVKFSVDQIGIPVLVRVSYFPNWDVSGAKGPYRVAPNMMVVIPTSTDVHLTYGRSSLDILAYLLTFLGIGLAFKYRRRQTSFAD